MANFFLTSKAIDDLSAIWEYTFKTWSENQADRYYRGLLEDCTVLAENQDLGKNYHEITGDIFGFRSGQHIIFYRKITESEIEITRILHSKMDLKNRIHE